MGRSQRHKVIIQATDSTGKGLSEKQPALRYVNQYANSQAFSVPIGEAGGPLKGSSMAGFPPTLIPLPGLEEQRGAELQAEGAFTDPGQFNLSGNPIYTSLPEGGTGGDGGSGGPEPEPGMEPTLEYIAPAEAVIGSTDFTMRIIGTNFTDSSVIYFNGGAEPTEFVTDTELTTGIKPSTASVPGTYPVEVKQGSYSAGPAMFTFTEPVEGGTRTRVRSKNDPAEQREFPIGPIGVTKIERVGKSLRLTLTGTDVQAGDFIRLESTHRTELNGDYRVDNTEGSVVSVRSPDIDLPQPLTNRGRVTIIAGGD